MPICNEEENIGQVLQEWRECLTSLGISYQLLLLNDGSKDGTLEVLKELEREDSGHVVLVDKPNSGHGRSCRLGYDACAGASQVEWVLQIDSDGQCDPGYFKTFWEKREEADCVFGTRVQRDDGKARMMMSKICRISSSILMGGDLGDPNVPYRLMRRGVLKEALNRIPPAFDIHNVALTVVLKKTEGLRWVYVPISFRDRQGGSNSINLLNVMQMGVSMLFDLKKLKKSLRK